MSVVQYNCRPATTLFALAALSILLSGCGSQELDTTYGIRRRSPGAESVNGTAVLAEMFEQAGHPVISWRRMSPKLERYDVIVWAPDDFQPPTEEHRQYLEDWLLEQPGRTLVYIGRDYDASIDYWKAMQGRVPAELAVEVARRLAQAQVAHDQRRAEMPTEEYARWFVMRRDGAPRQPRQLESPDGRWTEGIRADATAMRVQGKLDVPAPEDVPSDDYRPEFDILLRSDGDVLVTRVTEQHWEGSQILVVTNGSFLLNLPLVNREHRKLASQLIAVVERSSGQESHTVFLESGPGGPPILSDEPTARYPSVMDVMTVWPVNLIVLHVLALGLIACLVIFPIFGRARQLEPPPLSDFGKHIEALGEMLERSGRRDYALARVKHYQQHVKREIGSAEALRASHSLSRRGKVTKSGETRS